MRLIIPTAAFCVDIPKYNPTLVAIVVFFGVGISQLPCQTKRVVPTIHRSHFRPAAQQDLQKVLEYVNVAQCVTFDISLVTSENNLKVGDEP
jgi:hypothetical protein